MVYQISKYFEASVKSVKDAFKKTLTDSAIEKDHMSITVSKKINNRMVSVPCSIYFKNYRNGTAVLFAFFPDAKVMSFSDEVNKLVNPIEKELHVYASFCNLLADYFGADIAKTPDPTVLVNQVESKPVEQSHTVSQKRTASSTSDAYLHNASRRLTAVMNNIRILAIVFYVITFVAIIAGTITTIVEFVPIIRDNVNFLFLLILLIIIYMISLILSYACIKDLKNFKKSWGRAIVSFLLLNFLGGLLYIIWEP